MKYSLATWNGQGWIVRALSPQEAAAMQAEKLLSLNLWQRWGLLITFGGLVATGMVMGTLGDLGLI